MKYFYCTTILLSLIFSFAVSAQEVNGKITNGKRVRYKLVYKPQLDDDRKSVDFMDLIFDDKQSYFESSKKASEDSLKKTNLFQAASRAEQMRLRSEFRTEFPETIQIIPSRSEIHFTTSIIGSPTINLQYKEKFNPLWKLSAEKKTIAGMKCAKATTKAFGRTWTAWYSLDLPVHYGPYKFYGLPGIIVKLNDVDNNFDYEITELRNESHSYDINTRFMDITQALKSKVVELKKNELVGIVSKMKNIKLISEDGSEKEYTNSLKKTTENRFKTKNSIELTLEP